MGKPQFVCIFKPGDFFLVSLDDTTVLASGQGNVWSGLHLGGGSPVGDTGAQVEGVYRSPAAVPQLATRGRPGPHKLLRATGGPSLSVISNCLRPRLL
jgi:hypothetical protein